MKTAILSTVTCAALGISSSVFATSFDNVAGNGNVHHTSEFLFGFSGATPATLSLNGGSQNTSTVGLSDGGLSMGWWNREGNNPNNDSNDNYFVGDLTSTGATLLNNFFSFPLAGLSGGITSASLVVQRFGGQSDLGATAFSYQNYDVSTDFATLNANNGFSVGIYNDLGSGTLYGANNVTVAGGFGDILTLSLNGAAVADLNAAIGRGDQWFSIGGTIAPSAAAVPDAGGTLALLGLGVLGLVAAKRRS